MGQSPYLPKTWYDPRLRVGPSPIHGRGLFAAAPFAAGETVMIWGGDLYTAAELRDAKLGPGWSYSQVDEDRFLFAPASDMDYFINHSCDPNIWLEDGLRLVARRPIAAGEELRGDYATWDCESASPIDPCQCGVASCRRVVSGADWRRPELQARYAGHVLPFLARRFEALIGGSDAA
ncbi:MAG TPA: SET domain-containing protein-lysine N-methyltransferase [Herpetosiphonaceae bacterium]